MQTWYYKLYIICYAFSRRIKNNFENNLIITVPFRKLDKLKIDSSKIVLAVPIYYEFCDECDYIRYQTIGDFQR